VVGIELLIDAFGMCLYVKMEGMISFDGIEGIKFLECRAHPFPLSETELMELSSTSHIYDHGVMLDT
jgi:hypothetical protein